MTSAGLTRELCLAQLEPKAPAQYDKERGLRLPFLWLDFFPLNCYKGLHSGTLYAQQTDRTDVMQTEAQISHTRNFKWLILPF